VDDDLTESEIVVGLQAGDRHAWDALCQQYSRSVWTYVARLIGRDANNTADVFQETLMAVARSGRSLRDDTRLWPWLATIAHNQVALHWRRHQQRGRETLIAEPIDDSPPDEPLQRQETNADVRQTLSEMNTDYAALLEAKYIDELTVAEIVERFGGTTESVRSRLARARREFSERMNRTSAPARPE